MKSLSVCFLATGLFASGLAPAQAEDARAIVYKNGTKKGSGNYLDSQNKICAKAYNSTSGARVTVEMSKNLVSIDSVTDFGGDTSRTCKTSGGLDQFNNLEMRVVWTGSNGETRQSVPVTFNG